MALLRPTPWTTQPQVATDIDWGNPITRGLGLAWCNGVEATPKKSSTAPYGSPQTGKQGVSGKGNGSSTFALLSGNTNAVSAYGTSAGSNGEAITFIVATKIGGLSSQQHFINTGDGNNTAIGFRTNTTSVGLSNVNIGSLLNFTSAVTAGEECVLCLSGRNGSTDFFKNGKFIANDTTTTAGAAFDGTPVIGRSGGSTQYGDHAIYMIAVINRRLSRAEGISITANPWQIFKPIPRRIFVPVSVGSDVTITTTLGTADATGYNATISAASPVTINAALGTAAASGLSATLAQAFNLSANLGTATASGNQATIAQAATISASLGAATASGYTASVSSAGNVTISANLGSATASGHQATVNSAITVSASLGAASAAGYTAALEIAYTLAANLGTASATGNTATIYANESIACAIGTALASGYSATVTSTAQLTDSEKIDLILDILSNRQTLDPVSHIYTLFADDGVTVLKTALAWEDSEGTIPYRGQALQRLDEMQ